MSLFTYHEVEQICLLLVCQDPSLTPPEDALTPEGREVLGYIKATGGNVNPMDLEGAAKQLAQSLIAVDGDPDQLIHPKNAPHWFNKLIREKAKQDMRAKLCA